MGNCLKYGGKVYKPEILFNKIRKNPIHFAKKHSITGKILEEILNIENSVDYEDESLKSIFRNNIYTPNPIVKKELDFQLLKRSDFDSNGNVRQEVLDEINAEKEHIREQAVMQGTYLKAPNGADTNLTEEQWVLTRTQRFKEWFGDWENKPEESSKVVDENGEPKVVTHSTDAIFTEFINTQQNDSGWLGKGFYFFGDRTLDGQYGKNIMEVFLNVREPYYISEEEQLDLSDVDNNEYSEEFSNNVESEGYDGVYYNGDLNQEWNVFNPNQIKSANDNVGTYSDENNDIEFQILEGNTLEANDKFTPPHNNIISQKLLNELISTFKDTGGDKSSTYEALRNSTWYSRLENGEREKISVNTIADFILDQNEKRKENANAKKEWEKEQAEWEKTKYEKAYRDTHINGKTGVELLKEHRERRKEANRKLKGKKPFSVRWDNFWLNFRKKFTDRQFEVKNLLKKSGMNNTYNRIIVMAGASARANAQYEAAYSKIFKGLTQKEKDDLDSVIVYRRIIAIDENRKKRGLSQIRHSGGDTAESSRLALGALEQEIGKESYNKLNERASAYFDEYRNILKAMRDNGLIGEEQYESMVDIDYQPRMFIEHMLDADGNLMGGSNSDLQSNRLAKDSIKALKEGSFGELVTNAEWLLKLALSSRNSQMAMNEINKNFATRDYPQSKRRYDELKQKNNGELSKEDKEFVSFFEMLNGKVKFPKNKNEVTPKGYKKAYYFENGERQGFFLEEKFYDEWNDLNKGFFSNPEMKANVSKWSGSNILKSFATGINPAFMIANTPRDFGNIILFSPEYSNFSPLAALQLGKDALKGIKELIKDDLGNKDTLLSKYIEYGGGMDFLHTQGSITRDNTFAKALDKVLEPNLRDKALHWLKGATLLKLCRYSETAFRIAVFNRSLQNQLKEYNKTNNTTYKGVENIPDEQTKSDMYIQAVVSARSTMDFNQGGIYTKDLEAVLPYINAGVQGTRVAVGAFIQRPKQTSARVLQAGFFLGGIGVGISTLLFAMFDDEDEKDKKSATEKMLEAYNGISKHQRVNYINIVIPIKLDNGEYMVVKIAKTQAIAPVAYLAEEIMLNALRPKNDVVGKGEIIKNTMWAFNKNMSPIELPEDFSLSGFGKSGAGTITRNPIAKAVLSITTGYDFFRDQPLDKNIISRGLPLELEGIRSDKVEDFYKAFGELTSDSPVRAKAFVESFVTSPDNNMWLGILYGGLEIGLSDKKTFNDVFIKDGGIAMNTVLRRLKSETSEYNRMLRMKEQERRVIDEMIIKEERLRLKTDDLAKKFINKKMGEEDVKKELKRLSENENEYKKLVKRVYDKIKNKDVDSKIWDIKYNTGNSVEAKAYMIYKYYPNLKDHKEIQKQLKRNGLATDEIKKKYKQIKEREEQIP